VRARVTVAVASALLTGAFGSSAVAGLGAPTEAGAGAASAAAVSPSSDRSEAALRRAKALLEDARPAGGELTRALLRVVRTYPGLSAAGRRAAARLLSRPTDRRDPEGNSWRAPEAAVSPACTTTFCVHWVERTRDAPSLRDVNGSADGDGVPDYVEVALLIAEHAFAVENGELGWRQPKSDRRLGGRGGKTDIYLADIGAAGLFGYVAPDRAQARAGRFPRSLYSYLVLDDDYSRRQFSGTLPAESLAVTLAHEYNHVLGFSYDSFQDAWMSEATATWMEDQVFDSVNDYLRYMGRWVRRGRVPLTANSIKIYGSAVWNAWLERSYGRDLIRRAWAGARRSRPAGFSVESYGRAIRRAGPSDFNRDFARFAADLAEWRTASVFPEGRTYPDVPRSGRLGLGRASVRRLNHTTFRLLGIRPTRARALRVTARVPAGVTAALALVGRLGTETRGRPEVRMRLARGGGRLSLTLRRPDRFQRITAIAINADTKQRGFSPRTFDWRYLRDRIPFTLRARLRR